VVAEQQALGVRQDAVDRRGIKHRAVGLGRGQRHGQATARLGVTEQHIGQRQLAPVLQVLAPQAELGAEPVLRSSALIVAGVTLACMCPMAATTGLPGMSRGMKKFTVMAITAASR